jgi:hypothetical protein
MKPSKSGSQYHFFGLGRPKGRLQFIPNINSRPGQTFLCHETDLPAPVLEPATKRPDISEEAPKKDIMASNIRISRPHSGHAAPFTFHESNPLSGYAGHMFSLPHPVYCQQGIRSTSNLLRWATTELPATWPLAGMTPPLHTLARPQRRMNRREQGNRQTLHLGSSLENSVGPLSGAAVSM